MAGKEDILEQVIDVLEGRVQGDEAADVLARVASEPDWAAAHEWVRSFLESSRGATLTAVPPSTRAMLERLLPPRRTVGDDVRDVVHSIARLVRDRPGGVAFAGARGAAGTARQVHFAANDDLDIVLDLETVDGQLRLSGQLLGADTAGRVVAISDHPALAVDVDEFGEFQMTLPSSSFLRLDVVVSAHHTTLDLTALLDSED